MSPPPSRREVLRRLAGGGLLLGGAGLAAALGLRSPGRFQEAKAAGRPKDRRVEPDRNFPEGVVVRGGEAAFLVRAAVDRLGGIGRFVRRGDRVLLKPNMAWDRTPEQGANTHPAVVAEVARLCREAGAAKVIVADVPVHDAQRVATRSGIREAALAAGAEVLVPPGPGFKLTALEGSVLGEWEVFLPALEADRLINLPVVKDHALTRLTCGMKNWYGLLGGTRVRLHQEINLSIADLAAAFPPTLTIVDATRVMVRGGPTGGRLDDVKPVGAVAAGIDPVALDAWGASLLEVDPSQIGYLPLAEGRGLGALAGWNERLVEIHAGS